MTQPICTVRRCEDKAVIEATEVRGYEHRYCLRHLWQVEESDQVALIDSGTSTADPPTTQPHGQAVTDFFDSLPAVLPEPIYNEEGFGVGFRVVHPPGVECVFQPTTKRCSCGRMELGIVDPNAEEHA